MADLATSLTTKMTTDQAITWATQDVTYLTNIPAEANNLPGLIRLVATVMVELEYKLGSYSKVLKDAFQEGYRLPQITKGYHQQERLLSIRLGESVDVMHVTVRLYTLNRRTYRTMHVYVARGPRLAGATLWDDYYDCAVS
jgi:hypothetical protein